MQTILKTIEETAKCAFIGAGFLVVLLTVLALTEEVMFIQFPFKPSSLMIYLLVFMAVAHLIHACTSLCKKNNS